MARLFSLILALGIPAAAAAQNGRVVEHHVDATSLSNRLGDSTTRSVLIYLPPGYDDRPERRYPVVYLLHAYGTSNRTWLGGPASYEGLDMEAALDSLIAAGAIAELVVVMPDALTRWGGSWYVDSRVAGAWERFIAEDLTRYVDANVRTVAERSGRGIAGQSMGAYGALSIAMRRPDAFSAAFAMSPVHTEDPNPLGEAAARAALEVDPRSIAESPIPARVLWSKAAAFSPAADLPPAFARLPYRLENGGVVRIDPLWQSWLTTTLSARVEAHGMALQRLAIRLEVGSRDALAGEAERLSAKLRAVGIAHEWKVFDGDHVNGVRARIEESMLPFFSRTLEGAVR